MSEYEKICDFKNLYEAHLNSRKGKRNKSEVITFEMNLAYHLLKMQHELVNKCYTMKGYYHFTIYEPKKREIHATYYEDRVLQHCLCDVVLEPHLSKRLIYDNAACQKHKGTHFAMRRLQQFLCHYYKHYGSRGYVLKCDIKKYFANIDHDVLKYKLQKVFDDEDLLELLFQLIDSYKVDSQSRGLPLGNQTSQWFAIFYLDQVDRFIKEELRIKYYTRYMDDFILIHPDKKYLKYCLEEIHKVVSQDLKLTLNNKTQLFPLKEGIEYLGFRFYLKNNGKVVRRMRSSSKKRCIRRLHKLKEDYTKGIIDSHDVKQCLASYNGHLKHEQMYCLKKHVMKDLHIS